MLTRLHLEQSRTEPLITEIWQGGAIPPPDDAPPGDPFPVTHLQAQLVIVPTDSVP